MSIRHSPLSTVSPHHTFLCDPAVLVQAWKKSHEYVRQHNWYADPLELDVSAVTLHRLVDGWAADVRRRGGRALRPAPMRLVAAPKAAAWEITPAAWKPRNADQPRLRPLAHLTVRDQAFATAAMMCLADAVETAQRDPDARWSPGPLDGGRPPASSFGNRLVCRWRDRRAGFRWANAESYRRFYTDYRAFVRRADEALGGGGGGGTVRAVVHLDLERFYDRVDRDALVRKLADVAAEHHPADERSVRFFGQLRHLFDWRWHPDDLPLIRQFKLGEEGVGLPQGLVASGFFANAYLLDFDRAMRDSFGVTAAGRNWRIVDYFRYVDDLRVVVDCDDLPRMTSPAALRDAVVAGVSDTLRRTAPNLTVNPDKCGVRIRDQLPPVVRVAGTMAAVQSAASGPMDVTAAAHVIDLAAGLLPLAERAADAARGAADGEDACWGDVAVGVGDDDAFMADLFTTELDVRSDTVERFAANRLLRTLRYLREMCEDEGGDGPTRAVLDERAAEFSKALLRRWFADPSGVRLLRVAMDLLPLPRALNAVRKRLWPHVEPPAKDAAEPWTRYVCLYVAADLFRAAATQTAFANSPDALPAAADAAGYRSALCQFARACAALGSDAPWYVHQQAVLALVVLGGDDPDAARGLPNADLAGEQYGLLADLLIGTDREPRPVLPIVNAMPQAAVCVVAWRLCRTDDKRARVAAYAAAVLDGAAEGPSAEVVDVLEMEGAGLAEAVARHLGRTLRGATPPPTELPTDEWVPLPAASDGPENPFRQENAALVLLRELTVLWRGRRRRRWSGHLTPDRVEVSIRPGDPHLLADPGRVMDAAAFRVRIRPVPAGPRDPRFGVPAWCPAGDAWRIEVGRVVRGVIIGGAGAGPAADAGVGAAIPYRGVRSSHFKRAHGAFNGREALGGPAVPVSPWLCELLDRLIWWPGRAPADDLVRLPEPFTPDQLLALVDARLFSQAGLYGRSSGLPVYDYPIAPPRAHTVGRPMTFVLAQTVLPRDADFGTAGLTLDDPPYRRRHRRHLAAVLALLQRTLADRSTYGLQSVADVVVLPELAVHVDDLRLVERMIDKLKVIVFCGLVFLPREAGGPPVNCGMWLIPDERPEGRRLIRVAQGKQHPTRDELARGVAPFRPCQWLIHGRDGTDVPWAAPADAGLGASRSWRLTGAICYDATDLALAADLRNKTDGFVVAALNRDVKTFDAMVAALHYHMYQHVVLVNTGQFGGTTGQAPYKQEWEKVRVHCHGTEQVVISICELDLMACRPVSSAPGAAPATLASMKTPPAGWQRAAAAFP